MTSPVIHIVDDEPGIRDALAILMRSVGLTPREYADADSFLGQYRDEGPCCLIMDICLPGIDGMRLQEILHERDIRIPVIAMSAHGDIAMAVELVRRGALDFIEKPFHNHQVIRRVQEALDKDRERRERLSASERLDQALGSLSPRERELLPFLLDGASNKFIARALDLSPRTVEAHRANLLRKMDAKSVTALAAMLAGKELHHF